MTTRDSRTSDVNTSYKTPGITSDPPNNIRPQKRTGDEDPNDPYVYVDGKKEMKDGSGMVKESFVEEA